MDLGDDALFLLAQLQRIAAAEPPPHRVRAIYFGLFEATDGSGGPSRPVLYLSGSTRSADEPNWTCWEDDSWLPAARYLDLPTLASKDPAEWEAIEEAVAELLRTNRPAIDALLGTDRRPMALGWDDGEPSPI